MTVGAGTHISVAATVEVDVVFGQRCRVGDGCRIGDRGFGYQWLNERWTVREHPYGVRVGDRVELGPNVVVNRGRWRHTRIGTGTKVASQVFVAHNVVIGRDCLIVDQASFGGSVTVGRGVIVGLSATVMPHVTIGDGAIIGAGAVVTKDVPAGQVWAGNPARYMRDRREGETL